MSDLAYLRDKLEAVQAHCDDLRILNQDLRIQLEEAGKHLADALKQIQELEIIQTNKQL